MDCDRVTLVHLRAEVERSPDIASLPGNTVHGARYKPGLLPCDHRARRTTCARALPTTRDAQALAGPPTAGGAASGFPGIDEVDASVLEVAQIARRHLARMNTRNGRNHAVLGRHDAPGA